MSGEWICKTKEALRRVYITTETTCKNLVKGGPGRTSHWHMAVPSWGEGSFICFSLHSKQYRVLQAHDQTACSRVNRIWGLSWELSATGAKLNRCLSLKGCKSSCVYTETIPPPCVLGTSDKSQRGRQRACMLYKIYSGGTFIKRYVSSNTELP